MATVREATFDLLRRLGLTTLVGNPGSTEEPFLADFPEDFTYVLALQEASAVAIADGLAIGLGRPVLVNLHTSAGVANAMGNLVAAAAGKTPLIVTAGQQTRQMLLGEPFLTNTEAEALPRPWVKWSFEPRRPQDVPGALMRAYLAAIQPPAGPVFLSLPMDDWDQEMEAGEVYRTAARRVAPAPDRLAEFAARLDRSRSPVLVYGGDVCRSRAWSEGIALAERLGCPVWTAPLCEQAPFPQDHPLYAGALPAAIGPLAKTLAGHDLIVVIGAPVFRYYPWVPGDTLPPGAQLLQITDDPAEAARAVAGDSLLCDSGLALTGLCQLVAERPAPSPSPRVRVPVPEAAAMPLTARQAFEVLSRRLPEEYVLVNESPSNIADLAASPLGTITRPDSYYITASGGLGWGMPAAVGLAMAERDSGRNRPVVAVIGDGSFQFSPQAIWTGVQHRTHIVFVVLRNSEYGILKAFAAREGLAGIPGLDLPGLDIVALGTGYGATAVRAETAEEIEASFAQALANNGVSVIEVPIAGISQGKA